MKQEGLMAGYDDGEFKPEQHITRAEFAATVLRFMNRMNIVHPISARLLASEPFTDIADHWAYGQVEEASRTHESTRISDKEELIIRFVD